MNGSDGLFVTGVTLMGIALFGLTFIWAGESFGKYGPLFCMGIWGIAFLGICALIIRGHSR